MTAAAIAAQVAEMHVVQDRKQPGAEPRRIIEAVLAPERPFDAILDQVVGIRGVAQPGRGVAAQAGDLRDHADGEAGRAQIGKRLRHRPAAQRRRALSSALRPGA